jgi:hypothetical protein
MVKEEEKRIWEKLVDKKSGQYLTIRWEGLTTATFDVSQVSQVEFKPVTCRYKNTATPQVT